MTLCFQTGTWLWPSRWAGILFITSSSGAMCLVSYTLHDSLSFIHAYALLFSTVHWSCNALMLAEQLRCWAATVAGACCTCRSVLPRAYATARCSTCTVYIPSARLLMAALYAGGATLVMFKCVRGGRGLSWAVGVRGATCCSA